MKDWERFLGALGVAGAFLRMVPDDQESVPVKPKIKPYVEKPYQVEIIDDRLSVTFENDFYLGSITDSPEFRASVEKFGPWLSDLEMYVIRGIEDSSQPEHTKLGSRTYSGLPAYSHILGVGRTALQASLKVGVPLDYLDVVQHALHDDIEIDPDLRVLRKEWEAAAGRRDHDVRETLEGKISTTRNNAMTKLEQRIVGPIDGLDVGENGEVYADLRRKTLATVDNVSHLTRFSEGSSYAMSMKHVYSIQGEEDMATTLSRFLAKADDRIANVQESGPYSEGIMEAIKLAFEDSTPFNGHTVGKELTKRYGKINDDATAMPASLMVGTAFKSIYPLQFTNDFFNEHESAIETGVYGECAIEKLRLVQDRNAVLIESSLNLLDNAISFYESQLTKEDKRKVNGEIKDLLKGTYFNQVTKDGVMPDWTDHIEGGNAFMGNLDTENGMFKNYRAARHIQVIVGRYGEFHLKGADYTKPLEFLGSEKFNASKHRRYALPNVGALLELFPAQHERVAIQLSKG